MLTVHLYVTPRAVTFHACKCRGRFVHLIYCFMVSLFSTRLHSFPSFYLLIYFCHFVVLFYFIFIQFLILFLPIVFHSLEKIVLDGDIIKEGSIEKKSDLYHFLVLHGYTESNVSTVRSTYHMVYLRILCSDDSNFASLYIHLSSHHKFFFMSLFECLGFLFFEICAIDKSVYDNIYRTVIFTIIF